MYSILKEVEEYIEEMKMPFKSVRINYSYFSDYVNFAILECLRRLNGNNINEYGPMEYELSIDENGHMYLLAMTFNNKGKFVVSYCNNLVLDFAFEGISEEKLITQAYIYKSLNDFREIILEDVNRENFTDRGKINVVNRIMRRARISEYYRMRMSNENVLEKMDYRDESMNTVKKIKDYLDYLFLIYKDTVNRSDDDRMMHGVSYVEENSVIDRDSVRGKFYEYGRDSVGKVIVDNNKFDIIELYPYIYHDFAFDRDIRRIEYMNYLFKINRDEYVMMCEPVNSNDKASKLIFMHSDRDFLKNDFELIIKYYLELSDKEFDNDENTMRVKLGSLNDYRVMLNYIIYNKNEDLVLDKFKYKVRKIRKDR